MKNDKAKKLGVLAVVLCCATFLTACPHRRGEGPAERVGESMDKGAAAVGRGVEKTGEAIQDASGN